jgi:Heterokaryon incompatibility protein (HET)
MDHIPNVEPAVYQHIRVPYLHSDASYEYDYGSGEWMDFPYRCGWDNPNFLQIELSSTQSQHDGRFASLLQSWFYFGLLAETIEIPVNAHDFLDSSGETITTRRLPEFINDWMFRMNQLSWTEKSHRVKKLDHFFKEWHLNYIVCVQHNERSQFLPPEVQLSIAIMYATLLAAKKIIFPMSDVDHFGFGSQIVNDRLTKDGWCPSDLARLEYSGATTILGVYYCSLLGRRQVLRDHLPCSYAQCLACKIDPAHYEVRHVTEGCSCLPMMVDITKLCSILKKGAVPLIYLHEDSMSGKLSIELTESHPDVAYVAISHVWADGLGNPTANGLPLCQLRLLQMRVNSVPLNERLARSANVPFWIDTVCVPVGQEDKSDRETAVHLIAQTFQKAGITLVISPELSNCSISRSSQELAMRMVSTVWWRRLWTLQEGVLCKALVFQFRDGIVDVDEMLKRLQFSNTTFCMASQLLNEAVQEIRLLSELRSKPPQNRLTNLLNTVTWRSTSKSADEPSCLATILGLDPECFREIDNHKDRMKALILLRRVFPSNFIFCSVRRMSDVGYGWAPRTFAFRSGRDLSNKSTEELGEILSCASESGLDVQYAGIVFSEEEAPWRESETMLFRDGSHGPCFKVTPCRVRYSSNALSRNPNACLIFEEWPLQEEVVTKSFPFQRSHGMDELESVLADTGISAIDEMLENMRTPFRTIQYKSTRAMLGSVYGEVDGRIRVVCHSVARVEHSSCGDICGIIAEVLPTDQRWCVG